MHDTPFPYPFYTTELTYGEETICPKGKEKYYIDEGSVANFETGISYVCVGKVLNSMRSAMTMVYGNAVHTDLSFSHFNKEGEAILIYSDGVNSDHWKGLSGCPIIDENYHLAGILIRVSEDVNCITAKPISQVINLLDFAIDDISAP